jgi:uncharacterized membrane protein YhaH (DUF805 family)
MGIQEAVGTCLASYVGFGGRADRPEFWWWVLFVVAVWVIIWSCCAWLFGINSAVGAVAGGLFFLAAFLPSLAAAMRRLHDCDRTGWWLWLAAVPIVGWAVLIWLLARPGTEGPNRFGTGTPVFNPF